MLQIGQILILQLKILVLVFNTELTEFNRPKIQMSSIKQVTSGITAVQKKTVIDVLRDIQTTVKKFLEDINR